MSVIITNVSEHDGTDQISEYVVRINLGAPLAQFTHWRRDGLATCLRKAADALDKENHPNPFAQAKEGGE